MGIEQESSLQWYLNNQQHDVFGKRKVNSNLCLPPPVSYTCLRLLALNEGVRIFLVFFHVRPCMKKRALDISFGICFGHCKHKDTIMKIGTVINQIDNQTDFNR